MMTIGKNTREYYHEDGIIDMNSIGPNDEQANGTVREREIGYHHAEHNDYEGRKMLTETFSIVFIIISIAIGIAVFCIAISNPRHDVVLWSMVVAMMGASCLSGIFWRIHKDEKKAS